MTSWDIGLQSLLGIESPGPCLTVLLPLPGCRKGGDGDDDGEKENCERGDDEYVKKG